MSVRSLYPVDKKNMDILEALLTECFEKDPLYQELIPDEATRKRLLPELFECDLEEFFETCDIYADSEALDGVIIISDESKPYSLKELLEVWHAYIKSNSYIIKEDPSLRTFSQFIKGKDYLNSKWTEEIEDENRLHIIYLAVRPSRQHQGISRKLIEAVLEEAKVKQLAVSLETHNVRNVSFYEHFGFKLFTVIEKLDELKQYCLVYHPS